MTAPALTFLAPPSFGADVDDSPRSVTTGLLPIRSAEPGGRRAAATLRMTAGARKAATGLKVADADIRRCLDAPDDVSPDEDAPLRTLFRRGNLAVLTGPDGTVLRVDRGRR